MEKKEKVHDWTRTTKFSKPPDILTFNTVCLVLTNYLQHLKAFVAKLAFFLTANILNSKDPISSDWITFLTIHSKNLKFRAKTTRCFDHTAVTYAAAEHHTVMKILGIAYPKHWILLEVSKYLDENLMQIDLLVLSNWIYFWLSIICLA